MKKFYKLIKSIKIKAKLTVLLYFCIVFTKIDTTSSYSYTNDHRIGSYRAKRQNLIGSFRNIRCNVTTWKLTMKPYLEAESIGQRDPLRSRIEYDIAVENLNKWKQENIQLIHLVCGLQKYLECNEEGRCVCGNGNVPYSFKTLDQDICIAKRGSICIEDSDCINGLPCIQKYCGGAEAFLEESSSKSSKSTSVTKFTGFLPIIVYSIISN